MKTNRPLAVFGYGIVTAWLAMCGLWSWFLAYHVEPCVVVLLFTTAMFFLEAFSENDTRAMVAFAHCTVVGTLLSISTARSEAATAKSMQEDFVLVALVTALAGFAHISIDALES